ncbi:MAG: hypothetical protein WC763_00570 [Candidatus Paceibacterota bacterium]|jgi:hypothetical protein
MKTAGTVSPTATLARERRKQQRAAQEKMARMATSWAAWIEFEKPLWKREPKYIEELYRISTRISQEIVLADTRHGHKIRWDEARDRVLTLEFLESRCARFGKTHREIHHDVGRVAGHNAWMTKLTRRGDYPMLSDIIHGMHQASSKTDIKFAPIVEPTPMNARQIIEHTRRANERLDQARQAFLGDDPPQPKTGEFGFVADVRRQAQQKDLGRPLKRPRRNWRREY